ncbi:hypothetical protein LRD18_07835 [Halorhodospira halochloris]|uniref:Uncharacterized protein n=1 Tax=Halorhodospira halochloris TaxID=1052 RepID=A0A0X8X9Q0_HALHR|nr:hypothetical protein [Halorhodospira halochloris]MBK1652103.1 hypothetical protein [Halorhodospira halochloris]MCG5530785.1 hypothetical protein [Halorhodospira halochloris]BAU58025.1 hypothetical protein HH1059_13170 [Halorhodospira halochloris]
MHPIIPFAAGLAVGAVALRMIKNERTQSSIDRAGKSVRRATASGLKGIEGASSKARNYLESDHHEDEATHHGHRHGHGHGHSASHDSVDAQQSIDAEEVATDSSSDSFGGGEDK